MKHTQVRNKAVVREFYRRVFWDEGPCDLAEFVADDVTVHAPSAGEGLSAFADSVRQSFATGWVWAARPERMPRPVLCVADDDIVALCFYLPQPEPDGNGTFDFFSFDAFRLRDGKIVERWPSINKAAPTRPSWTDWTADPTGPEAHDDPRKARQLAVGFYRHVFDSENAEAVAGFVTEDYRQHARHMPSGRAGLEGLVRALFPNGARPMPEPMTLPPALLAAEGNIVVHAVLLPQPEPEDPTRRYPYYVFDAYGIRDGRIAEHWSGVNKACPPRHV